MSNFSEELCTIRQTCFSEKCCRTTVHNRINAGHYQKRKIGGSTRLTVDSVRAFRRLSAIIHPPKPNTQLTNGAVMAHSFDQHGRGRAVTTPTTQKVEISHPCDYKLGKAVWALVANGFIVKVTPSGNGDAPRGAVISVRQQSGRYRMLDSAALSVFTHLAGEA